MWKYLTVYGNVTSNEMLKNYHLLVFLYTDFYSRTAAVPG